MQPARPVPPDRAVQTESTELRVQLAPPVRLASTGGLLLVLRYHLQPERRGVLQRFVLRLAAGFQRRHPADTSASFWSLLAQQGATGATGAAGSNGAAVPVAEVQRDRAVQTESTELRVQLAPPVRLASTGSLLLGPPVPPITSTTRCSTTVRPTSRCRVPTPATSQTLQPPFGRCWRNKAPLAQPEPRVRTERVQPARPVLTAQPVPPDRAVQTESTELRVQRALRCDWPQLAVCSFGPPVPPTT